MGHGLTFVPTQHEFHTNGRTMWTWCAGDAIIFPAWINRPADIKSPCTVTGEMIDIAVTPDTLKHVKPPSAAASLVTEDARVSGMSDVRAFICSGQVFFKSVEVGKHWQEKHPNSLILPVRDYFELYKQVDQQMWRRVRTESKAA